MPNNKTIGLIQLGNSNQVLETILAFKDYTKSFTDIHKTIIVKSSAMELESLLKEEFEEILYIQDLDKSSIEKNLKYLNEEVLKCSFSVLINLTYSKASSYLCSLINAKFKLGFKYSKTNTLAVEDSWSKYIYAVLMGKNINPFSIVDIYKSIIGNKKTTFKKSSGSIDKIIFNTSENECKYFDYKSSLTKIMDNFPDLPIFLIGKDLPEDPTLVVKNIEKINSVGEFLKLDITNGIYIGCYSPYSLICSYYNLSCINIYPTNGDPHLYIPYGPNNLSCLESIAPKSLVDLIRNQHGDFIFKTHQGSGYFLYNTLPSDRSYDIEDVFHQFYKYAFAIFFEDIEETIQIPSLKEKCLNDLDFYKSAIETLRDLTVFGKKYSIFIIEELSKEKPEIPKIKGYGEKIDEIDLLSTRLKKNYPLLGTAIDYFLHSRAMVQGENLLEVTQNIFFNFEEYTTFLEIILELINNIKSRFTIVEKGK
jgi:hypothetical protein